MPIKKDGSGKRWVEMELLVPGTPDQVWEAMATGPGMAAWFVKGVIEPKVGGKFELDFGQGVTTAGQVTTWQPPNLFGYVERDWEPNAPPVATEITITARSGDQCLIRMVHSLFTDTGDWDNQIEGFENGWPGYFAVLRVYLAHFAGRPAASFIAMNPSKQDAQTAWPKLMEALALQSASVGERSVVSFDADAWAGVVEHVYQDARQRYVVLRLDSPAPGIALVGTSSSANVNTHAGITVSVCRYSYGDDASNRAAVSEPRWRDWLMKTFGG